MAEKDVANFLGALDSFGKSLQSYGMQRTLNQANEQVQAIRQAEMNDKEKTDQIRQVADNLSMYLLGQNAPAATIQQARAAFMPREALEQKEEYAKFAFGQEKEMAKIKHGYDLDLAFLKGTLADKADNKKITGDELKKLQTADEQLIGLKGIAAQFASNPNLVSAFQVGPVAWARSKMSGEFSRFKADVGRYFDAYRHAITGAQASMKEIQWLLQRTPQVGDSQQEFLGKLKSSIVFAKEVRKRWLKTLAGGGRDISRLQESPLDNIDEQLGIDLSDAEFPGFDSINAMNIKEIRGESKGKKEEKKKTVKVNVGKLYIGNKQ